MFVSALEQSEQLLHAAEAVGTAARPLPLFYALSQAGRAIAAQRLPDPWRLAGHGISAPPPTAATTSLLRRLIKPSTRSPATDRRDAFAGVAEAVGSDRLTGAVELGALWAAIPDLIPPRPQIPSIDADWLRPLEAVSADWNDPNSVPFPLSPPFELLISGLPSAAEAEAWTATLAQYPSMAGGVPLLPAGFLHDPRTKGPVFTRFGPDGEAWPSFKWPDVGPNVVERAQRLDEIAPDYRDLGRRLIVPRLGEAGYLSPLMLWWALLFGLSSIARYDPELWVAALDVNSSELAVPIEAALEAALDAVPALVLEALLDGGGVLAADADDDPDSGA